MNAYIAHVRTSLREEFRYLRSDALPTAVVSLIFVSVTLMLYAAISKTTYFGIFTHSQMVWYLIIAELLVINQGGFVMLFTEHIKDGSIVMQLLRPYHYPLAQYCIQLGRTLILTVLVLLWAVPLGIYLSQGNVFTPLGVFCGALLVLLAFALDFLLNACIGAIAFWTEDATPYAWIYSKFVFILGGLFFPLEIYPSWLQSIAKVLPGAFLVYYPARVSVDFSLSLFLHALLGVLAYLLFFSIIFTVIYKRAVRRVEVNGG